MVGRRVVDRDELDVGLRPSSAATHSLHVGLLAVDDEDEAQQGHARRQANSRAGRARLGATLSHMDVGVRELRNDTARVIDAVRAGERVTLTVRGEPVADIVPHGGRTRWLAGAALQDQLTRRAADPALRDDLDALAGQTPAEL